MAVQKEPYRLFFPLGALFGVAGVGHWFLYGTNVASSYSGFYHSSVQVWLFMTCFVVGFLGTAVPRFTSSQHANSVQIISWLAQFIFIFWALLASRWVLAEVGYIVLLINTVLFLAERFRTRANASPPSGFLWMPLAMFMAIVGTVLLIAGQAGAVSARWQLCGRAMEEQGFLMSLVLGIGSFLGPRLMEEPPRVSERHLKRCHLLAIPVFSLSFFLEGGSYDVLAYCIRGVAVFFIFLVSGALLFKIPRAGTLFSKYLAIAFWVFPVSFFLIAANPQSKTLFLHVLFMAGFAYLSFFIATMVTLSHAGEVEHIKSRLTSFFKWLSFLTAIALGLRLSAAQFGEHYFAVLGAASFVWILSALLWLVHTYKYFFLVPDQDAIEKIHRDIAQKKERHAC